MTTFTYEERNAIIAIRKAMRNKPEIINEIMKNSAHAMAGRVLLQAKTELEQLLEVNRAFVAAASALAKKEKDPSCQTPPTSDSASAIANSC